MLDAKADIDHLVCERARDSLSDTRRVSGSYFTQPFHRAISTVSYRTRVCREWQPLCLAVLYFTSPRSVWTATAIRRQRLRPTRLSTAHAMRPHAQRCSPSRTLPNSPSLQSSDSLVAMVLTSRCSHAPTRTESAGCSARLAALWALEVGLPPAASRVGMICFFRERTPGNTHVPSASSGQPHACSTSADALGLEERNVACSLSTSTICGATQGKERKQPRERESAIGGGPPKSGVQLARRRWCRRAPVRVKGHAKGEGGDE